MGPAHSFILSGRCPSPACVFSLFVLSQQDTTAEGKRECTLKIKLFGTVTSLPFSGEEWAGEPNKKEEQRRSGSLYPSLAQRTDTTKDGVLGEASRLQGAAELQTIFFGACQAVQ